MEEEERGGRGGEVRGQVEMGHVGEYERWGGEEEREERRTRERE